MSELNQQNHSEPREGEPLPIHNDTAAYLELLLESEKRKEHLDHLLGVCEKLKESSRLESQFHESQKRALEETIRALAQQAEGAKRKFAALATMVCPLLRSLVAMMRKDDCVHWPGEWFGWEQRSLEALLLLEPFESP